LQNEGNDADAVTVRKMLIELSQKHPECRRLAEGLYPFTHGRYRHFFCGRANIDMRWEVGAVEFQDLQNMPELRAIILAMALVLSTEQMYMTDRSIPKVLLVDEAHQFLGADFAESSAMAATLAGVTRKARKHRGSTGFITQTINDWFSNRALEVIFNTSEWSFFLGQRPEAIERAIKENKIHMTDFEVELFKSVTTERGRFSEILVRMASSGACEVMRYFVDPFSYAIQTTDPSEKPKIDEMVRKGLPSHVAAAKFAVDKFGEREIKIGINEIVDEFLKEERKRRMAA